MGQTNSEIMLECLEEMRYQQVYPIIRSNGYWKDRGYPGPEEAARAIAHEGAPELNSTYGLLALAQYHDRMKEAMIEAEVVRSCERVLNPPGFKDGSDLPVGLAGSQP